MMLSPKMYSMSLNSSVTLVIRLLLSQCQTSHITDTMVPAAILGLRMIKIHNMLEVQYLVQWEGHPDFEAIWEIVADFVQRFPEFPAFEQT